MDHLGFYAAIWHSVLSEHCKHFEASDWPVYGKVKGIRSLISYEGTTINELTKDFHEAIDSYLALCESEGIEPETPSLPD